jgi:hypothetical protein
LSEDATNQASEGKFEVNSCSFRQSHSIAYRKGMEAPARLCDIVRRDDASCPCLTGPAHRSGRGDIPSASPPPAPSTRPASWAGDHDQSVLYGRGGRCVEGTRRTPSGAESQALRMRQSVTDIGTVCLSAIGDCSPGQSRIGNDHQDQVHL